MKTLAELKRVANSNTTEARMTYRYGREIPDKMKGWRKMIKANSVAIMFLNPDGRESEMRVYSAKLIDYTGDTLTVYDGGYRELTAEENAAMNEWREIEKNDTTTYNIYYKMVDFFKSKGFPYLLGNEVYAGKWYDRSKNKVRDYQIKGDVALKYELRLAR